MPKASDQENSPNSAQPSNGGLKEPSDLAVSPGANNKGAAKPKGAADAAKKSVGGMGAGGMGGAGGMVGGGMGKSMGGGSPEDMVADKLGKGLEKNKGEGEKKVDKAAGKAAEAGITAATGGLGAGTVAKVGGKVVEKVGVKRLAKASVIIIITPLIIFGFLVSYILNGGAWDALKSVMTDAKAREFVITTAGNWAESTGMPAFTTDIAVGISNFVGLESEGVANAADTTGLRVPEPGSFEEKVSKIDWAKAQFQYQGESKNDCSYEFKLQKRIFADGVIRSVPLSVVNKKTGGETPIREIDGNATAGYCIAKKYPLFNMLWRQPTARELNKKADIALSYAAPKDSPEINTNSTDTKKYVRDKTLERVTTKKDAEKTITFESKQKEIDKLTQQYENVKDRLPDVKADKLNNPSSSDNINVQEGINKMYQAMKDGTDPYDINVAEYISIPAKDSAPNGSEAEKEAVKLNLARTICPFAWGFNDTSSPEGKKNARLSIQARLTGAQRGAVKNLTLTDTRQADALSNNESNASITQNDSWASSTAYSLDVYNSDSGIQINPEATHNTAYSAKKGRPAAEAVFSSIVSACDDVSTDGFFEKVGFGTGDNFNKAYADLKNLIIADAPPSFGLKEGSFGMEQIITAFMRTGSNTGVSGLEPGPDNYNRQSMGYRQLINDYTISTGGRFLSEEEAKNLALRADGMNRQMQKDRGIAYRLFDTSNINSLASIFQQNTLTPKTTRVALVASFKSLLNPIRSLASIHSNLSFYLAGSRNKAFAADNTGDQYFAIDTAGFTPQELVLSPKENYEIIDKIKKGSSEQDKADQIKFSHYDACFKEKISSKILLETTEGEKYPFKYYDFEVDPAPESEYTKKMDCRFVLVEATDINNPLHLKAIRYRMYTYYNYQIDFLTKLSSEESDDSIYANSSTPAGATGDAAAGTAPPGAPGDTTALVCPPGTEDGGTTTVYGLSKAPKYNIRLCKVGVITVNASIAANLKALLDAASASGINFGGGGFRDYEGQIQARIRNKCPDVYTAGSGSCAVPTARPGESNHGSGEAIDFTQNGGTLTKGSSGFNWLAANASKYFLINLASEPWHWSVNGN